MHTRTAPDIRLLEIFVFLQLLDFLTTLVGIRFGAQEANPFIRLLMDGTSSTLQGLILCKLLILLGGATVLWYKRFRVVLTLNYIFGALVVWNLTQLLKIPTQ